MPKITHSTLIITIVVLLALLLYPTTQACYATCQTCSIDNSANDCTACDGANFRNFQNGNPSACICDIGYVDSANPSSDPVCVSGQCSYTCPGLCRGTASTCTACNAGNFRTLTGTLCKCDSGYYDDGTNQPCVQCGTKCKQCSGSSTSCTDCYNTQFRSLSGSSCNCLTGYYDDGTDTCQPCSYKCATCSGTSTACVTCAGGATRSGTPACNCVAKYYDDGSNSNCASCHYSCATCVNGVSCSTCDSANKRVYSSDTGLCACMSRFYNSGTLALCAACHNTCLTCTASANTNCVTCNSASKRVFNAATGKCDCSTGYYATSATVQLCASCHVSCATCSGALSTNCLTCDSTRHRSISSTSCPCVAGYYNNVNNLCVTCHSSCATCSSSTACLTCPSATQTINSVTGICQCATTKYWDSSTSACVTCANTCPTCSITGTNCTSCDSTTQKRLLSGNTCVCMTGYKEGASGTANCVACPYSCMTCDLTGCLTCNATARRTKSGTSCLCNQGFYDDGTNMLCKACSATCASCTTSSTNCNSCDSITKYRTISGTACICLAGYFDPGTGSSICSKCSNKCSTCTTSATNCVACAGTVGGRTAAPNCLCNSGTYDDGSSANCVACHYSCKTCTNGLSCSTCDATTNKRILSLATNLCACNIRFYDDGTNVLCASCHATCLTCSGAANTNCLTCNSASQRTFQSSTGKCICISKFYQTAATTQLCSTCHATCLTCSDATISGCLTCSAAQQRITDGAGKCLCNTGFYLDSSFVCQPCHVSCTTCTSASPCVTCPSATQTINPTTGICECSTTTVWDSATSACVACHYSCATCYLSGTNCTTCDTTTNFRAKVGTSCNCLAGYYDNSVAICAPCAYGCLTCDVNGCLTCDANSRRNKSGTICPCNDGYYDDGSHSMCANCHYSCKTCTTSTTCTDCNPLLFRQIDTNTLCKCKILFYEDLASLTCQPCLYSCASCDTGDRCLTCQSATNHRVLNTTNTLCQCQNKYYDDGAAVLCLPCLYDCFTCLDYSSCTSCDLATENRQLDPATNRCTCVTRYFEDNSVSPAVCAQCLYSCLTCTNNIGCVLCNSASYRVKNVATGQCDCMPGYYDDGTNQLCLPCHYTCETCLNAASCATCDSGTLRTVVTLCDCPINYYDDGSTKVCHACHYSCETCTSTISCLTCDSILHFRTADTTSSYCKCMDGYYDDGYSNQMCVPCHYTCLTCSNPSACLTCNTGVNKRILPNQKCICMDGFYDDGANHPLCATCQYSCKSCIAGTQCVLCNALKFRQFEPTSRLCACIEGYYDTGASIQLCQPCSYTCKTCSLANIHCTSCEATNIRTLNAATNSCPCNQYYYDDLINPLCLSCHYSCLTCTDSVTCSSCDAIINRIPDATNDLCKCADRFYDDGNNNRICNACQSTCLTCLDDTACTSCDTSALRLLNTTANYAGDVSPFCVCIYKYYPAANPQSACLPCHYSCGACNGANANHCLHCSTDAHRVYKAPTHTCPCIDGYFDNGSIETCLICHTWCTKCTTAASTTCTACAANYFLKLDVTSCYATCPNYFFGKTSTMTCEACSSHCITCTSATVCTSCDIGFPLYQDACVDPCPAQSTFLDTPNNKCIDCPTGCLTCNSLIYCTSCVTDYYLDAQLHLCFECNQYCKGCTGPAQNQCIDCQYPLYLNNNQCFNISCPYGKYIDSHQGCLQCKSLFANSLTCTISKATLCEKLYKVKNGVCAYCTTVPGYVLTSTGDCSQICGDGVLIDYQCDDGNNLDGDGCSSNCLAQKGWNCQTNANGLSVCALDGAVSMTFNKAIKYGGSNKIKIYLTLSVPIRLNSRFFQLNFEGLSNSNSIQWEFSQTETKLQDIQFTITYSENIDQKKFSLSYDTNRRRLLTSITLTFTQSFTLSSYPPANYYADSEVSSLTTLKNAVFVCGLILLILCAINFLFVRKMYIHLIISACMPAQIFILYGLAAENNTDWIKWSLERVDYLAFIGGFKIGTGVDLAATQHFAYSIEVTKNLGVVGCVMLALWVIYAALILCKRYCWAMNHGFTKICMYFRYFVLTVQLCVLPHMSYSAINALYNSTLTSQTSSINVCIAIFVNIYILGLIAALFIGSKSLKPNQLMLRSEQNVEESVQQNISVNLRPKSRQMTETKHDFFLDTYSRDERQTQKYQMESSRNQLAIPQARQPSKKSQQISSNGDIKQHEGIGYFYDHIQIYKKVEEGYLNDWLIYDYAELYATGGLKQNLPKVNPQALLLAPPSVSNQVVLHKFSNTKFYLAVTVLKIYLFSLVASVAQGQLFILYCVLSGLSICYILYLILVRPFKFGFSNLRLILNQICFIFMSGLMAYYAFGVWQGWNYNQMIQKVMIGLICSTLALGIVLLLMQTLGAWRMEIWNKLQPCLVAMRLRGARKVMQYRKPRPKLKISEQPQVQLKKEEEKEEQMQAFFARMLQKQALQKQYRRERMMKNPKLEVR